MFIALSWYIGRCSAGARIRHTIRFNEWNFSELANVADTDEENYTQYQLVFEFLTRAHPSMMKSVHKDALPPANSQTMVGAYKHKLTTFVM